MTAPTAGSGMKWVGRAIRRLEDPALVAGRGRFTGDLNSALWVRFVRSPVASGRIVGIAAPDGARIYRAADLDGVRPIRPMLHKFNYQPIEQPILAADVVRFVGEPIAAVVASSPAEAEDIAEAVAIEIAELPSVVDAQEALKPGAAQVHDNCPANVVVEGRFKTADFDATIARAHKIVSVGVRSRRQNATPLEARAAHAAFDPASGRVTLTCTTQMPHVTRTAIADSLQFPESDLRVVAPDVGGGFGQKVSLPTEYVFLVWLARKLRGTVAWSEDRRENLIAAFHSRDQHVQLEGAFDAAGKLIALSADVVANIGAYSCFPTTCGVEPLMAMAELPGPYDVAAYACVARGVATHTCTMAPYRGVSRPVITFAIERLMDKAAAAFDLGPDEIRRRNLIKKFPYTSATGLVFDEGSYVETLEQAIAHVDLGKFRVQQRDARTRGRYRGIGFATFSERTGYGSAAFAARGMEITPGWETVEITMDPSGAVEARIGASPHGQGLRTTLAQIIADEIGVAPQQVRIVHGDTDRTPYGWGTFASRSLVIAGGASLLAAQKIRKKLLAIASHVLEAATDDIVLENGHAKVLGTDRVVAIAALARAAYHQTHQFKGEITSGIERKRRLRSARHLLQCLSRRHRRGRYRDRPRRNRKIHRGGGCRPHHQSDDCRRPGARRHRARHWQCAVRGNRLRRQRQSADRDACRLHAADRVRNSADRIAPHRIAGGVIRHRRQGLGRRRRHRRPGRHPQRHQRRAIAVRRLHRRNPGNAAAHPGGAARFRNWASGIRKIVC